MVQEILGILIVLFGGPSQPVYGPLFIVGNFFSGEVQLAQYVLGVRISSFCRFGEPLYGVFSILFD